MFQGKLLALGLCAGVVLDDQRRIAATGRGAETFQEMDGHGHGKQSASLGGEVQA